MTADVQSVPFNPMTIVASTSEGRASESHWFDSEKFLDPGFNAEQYVADLRRYVSLPGIRCYACIYANDIEHRPKKAFPCLMETPRIALLECISILRSPDAEQVPLETLSSELDAYRSVLKSRLLEVINEHYADFVSLSSRLVNVDSDVQRMQKPLLQIKVSMLDFHSTQKILL